MADNQPAAFGAQGGIEFNQRFTDEMNAAVTPAGQSVENLAVENKDAKNLFCTGQGRAQGGVIMVAQVAAKPDKGFFFFHGWFVPSRRLKFQSWTTST